MGKFALYQPEWLHEKGLRPNNEDAIFPEQGTIDDRLFMVCDGVGGQRKGEVASSLLGRFITEYFQGKKEEEFSVEDFKQALSYAETKLEEFLSFNKDCEGMATTLSLVLFSEGGKDTAHIVWVGDSRVYHIRDGEILFQTRDHSEVQELVDMGEITPVEAKVYPRRNVILRAVSSASSPSKLDYHQIENLFPGDFFLLCSDGILENLDDDKINNWFKKESTPKSVKALIFDNAEGRTKDNFSLYLLKIKNCNST